MFSLRSWATPITIGSFVISALSGVILFFHWNIGMMKPAHEYLSWFLIVGVAMHIVINWRSMLGYFKKPIPLAIIGTFFVLTALSFFTFGGNSPAGGGKNMKVAMKSFELLQSAPVTTIAQLSNVAPSTLTERLKAKGIVVESADQTLNNIAQSNDLNGLEVLSILIK
jgi:hypothetical protein